MSVLSTSSAAKPNIVFIMADDLGWADVGFNGATFYETPNIDQLAADGMIFDRGYTGGPNCAPTRGCLMSGMYTPRHKIYQPGGKSKGKVEYMRLLAPNKKNKESGGEFEVKNDLPASTVCLAEVLNPQGYKTAMFGKWHLGDSETQGFDVFDKNGKSSPNGKFYGKPTVTRQLAEAAAEFISENRDGPFFVYLSFWDVHTPHRAEKPLVQKYEEKLAASSGKKRKPVYAAMIEAVDSGVGRVRKALKQAGVAGDTLVIFTSDNGLLGSVHSGPLKGAKGSLCEGGVRVPMAMAWPGVIEAGSRCDTPITSVDFMPTFAELAGGALPTTQPVDGRSIVPLIKGQKALSDRAIFWHYPLYLQSNGQPVVPIYGTDRLYWRAVPSTMIMKGDWKLTLHHETGRPLLYNIGEDPSETTDLANRNPEKTQELLEELKIWISETKAPVPATVNPDFTPPSS